MYKRVVSVAEKFVTARLGSRPDFKNLGTTSARVCEDYGPTDALATVLTRYDVYGQRKIARIDCKLLHRSGIWEPIEATEF
jgi:hypothetical protein